MFKNVKRLMLTRVFCDILAFFTINLFSFILKNKYVLFFLFLF